MNPVPHNDIDTQGTNGEKEYQVLVSSCGIVSSNSRVFSLFGKDSLDFLHRLSTNYLSNLQVLEFRTTIFVTEKGRIVDLADVLRIGEDAVLIVSGSHTSRLQEWLAKFIVMEDVTIRDVTQTYCLWYVVGPQAEEFLHEVIHEDESKKNRIHLSSQCWFYQDSLWDIPCYRAIAEASRCSDFVGNLFVQGMDAFRLTLAKEETMNVLRVEQGIPGMGKELTEHVNPLEADLQRFVSVTKGCYVGQEVIARLDMYNKLQHRLHGFMFQSDRRPNLSTGGLRLDGNDVGWTTNHVWSYSLNKEIALGYLKTNTKASSLDFKNQELPESVRVTVVDLPFPVH